MLQGVIQRGTGRDAQIGEFAAGKTGTTENYGDAWFVGFNKDLTVAVWVGYPDSLKPMETEYGGSPVAGGTYPAAIWRAFMEQWIGIRDTRKEEEDAAKRARGEEVIPDDTVPYDSGETSTDESGSGEAEGTGEDGGGGETGGDDGGGSQGEQTPQQPQQPSTPQAPSTPAPAPQGGGGGETGGGSTPSAGQ